MIVRPTSFPSRCGEEVERGGEREEGREEGREGMEGREEREEKPR